MSRAKQRLEKFFDNGEIQENKLNNFQWDTKPLASYDNSDVCFRLLYQPSRYKIDIWIFALV